MDSNAPSIDRIDTLKANLQKLTQSDESRVFDYCLSRIEEELNTALDADVPEIDRLKANVRIQLLNELSGLISPKRKLRVKLPDHS